MNDQIKTKKSPKEFLDELVDKTPADSQGSSLKWTVTIDETDFDRLVRMARKGIEAQDILKKAEDAAKSNEHWCPVCKESPPGEHVTFEGYHESCGTFIDYAEGEEPWKSR